MNYMDNSSLNQTMPIIFSLSENNIKLRRKMVWRLIVSHAHICQVKWQMESYFREKIEKVLHEVKEGAAVVALR